MRYEEDFLKSSSPESTMRVVINRRKVRKRVIAGIVITEIIERWTKDAVGGIRCRKITSCSRDERDAWRRKKQGRDQLQLVCAVFERVVTLTLLH